ncbi:MAG: hypothetical protein IKN04_11125 [Clostridia bacterium]|nr:hypothetical protein [Clostridia bacterium]
MTINQKLKKTAEQFYRGTISLSEAESLMEGFIIAEIGEGPRFARQNIDWYTNYVKLKRKSWRLLLRVTGN